MEGKAKAIVILMVLAIFVCASPGFAAQKRCTAQGKKVVCPTRTAAELEKATDNYEQEAMDFAAGKGGSTYGIQPFDYLTGVGKQTSLTRRAKKANTKDFKVTSGYAEGSGKTEVWDRVKNAAPQDQIYNQWANNWSPSFKTSLIPGASPNEGKHWYYVYCVGCHGWTLKGDGPNAMFVDPFPRDLTAGKKYMNKKANLELFTVIKGGGKAVDLSESMPSWGNLLQDQDIWNVVAWIRANADRQAIKTIGDYLNPKSSFNPKSKVNKVNALNYKRSDDFQDAQEMMEATLAGRGAGLEGGGFVEGGMRKKPEETTTKGY
ncbi:MAG: cytochrome c [Proteobacteria bacterium]|nr:cytochrome c [Pseudomonadota bacterium]